MPYIIPEGMEHRLFYLDMSPDIIERPPVVFLHGFTLDHRMWIANATYFKNDFRVILMDARGHGLSDSTETGYSRAHRVADLLGFLDALRLERVHLVGLSMGGATAIGFALAYEHRLASMTLVDTGAAGYSPGKKITRIDNLAKDKGIEEARQKWIDTTLIWYKKDKEHIKQLMLTMMTEHSGAVWLDPMRGKYPGEDDLSRVNRITVPTKIFVGEKDRIFLPLAQKLHERITNSSLSIYDGVGHMLNLEEPVRFNEELKVFLESAR